jgi:hypothetical protein
MVTKPVSVTFNGNVNKKTNNVTVERNGHRSHNRYTNNGGGDGIDWR